MPRDGRVGIPPWLPTRRCSEGRADPPASRAPPAPRLVWLGRRAHRGVVTRSPAGAGSLVTPCAAGSVPRQTGRGSVSVAGQAATASGSGLPGSGIRSSRSTGITWLASKISSPATFPVFSSESTIPHHVFSLVNGFSRRGRNPGDVQLAVPIRETFLHRIHLNPLPQTARRSPTGRGRDPHPPDGRRQPRKRDRRGLSHGPASRRAHCFDRAHHGPVGRSSQQESGQICVAERGLPAGGNPLFWDSPVATSGCGGRSGGCRRC